MKRIVYIFVFFLSALWTIKSQNTIVSDEFKMKMNIKTGIGAAIVSVTNVGINSFVSASAELPLSKIYNWSANVGIRFVNDNIFDYGRTNWREGENYSVGRLEIPVIFSYDQPIYNNAFIRFNFGVYYSQLLFQTMNVEPKNTQPTSYIKQFIYDAGAECGIAFLLNKFYISIDYDILVDMLYSSPVNTIRAGVGLRF